MKYLPIIVLLFGLFASAQVDAPPTQSGDSTYLVDTLGNAYTSSSSGTVRALDIRDRWTFDAVNSLSASNTAIITSATTTLNNRLISNSVSNTAVTTSLLTAINARPSEVRSRTRVEARILNVALAPANTVVYTVTAGKILYVTSYIISTLNNANAIGEWRIRDNVTDKMSFLTGEKPVGAAAVGSINSLSLIEPIPFTTSVTVNEISGDMRVSFYILGYEESN